VGDDGGGLDFIIGNRSNCEKPQRGPECGDGIALRPVSMHVSWKCHTHISKIADLAGSLTERVSSDKRGVSSP